MHGFYWVVVISLIYWAEPSICGGAQISRPLLDVTWFAPFYSGGGYCSEAISVVLALEKVGFQNFSVEHHGDSVKLGPFLSETDKRRISHYDVLNSRRHANMEDLQGDFILSVDVCHSEPGAWSTPTPKYRTRPCPSDRFLLRHSGIHFHPYNIGRTMFETDRIPIGWEDRLNFMDEIWVPTEFARDIFQRAGVSNDKLVVIGEAVDTEFYRPQDILALTTQERVDLQVPTADLMKQYNTIFLFVGKFEGRKGLSTLLRAYFREFSGQTDVVLLILTSAYHSSSDMEAELHSLLQREKLDRDYFPTPPPYVILTDVPQEGMPYLYSLASALVIPSYGEGWGRPHLEAMSCARPVLATNWSGPTAFIRHADTGYLISIEPNLIPAE